MSQVINLSGYTSATMLNEREGLKLNYEHFLWQVRQSLSLKVELQHTLEHVDSYAPLILPFMSTTLWPQLYQMFTAASYTEWHQLLMPNK